MYFQGFPSNVVFIPALVLKDFVSFIHTHKQSERNSLGEAYISLSFHAKKFLKYIYIYK